MKSVGIKGAATAVKKEDEENFSIIILNTENEKRVRK